VSIRDGKKQHGRNAQPRTRSGFARLRTRAESWHEDADGVTIEAVAATETPVRRYESVRVNGDWFSEFDEILPMDALNDERLADGIPLTNSHSTWDVHDILGRVEDYRIDGDKLVVTIRLGAAVLQTTLADDIRTGVISDMSIGYVINDWTFDTSSDPPQLRAADWSPYEVAVVVVPADRNAGIRSGGQRPQHQPQGRRIMSGGTKPNATTEQKPAAIEGQRSATAAPPATTEASPPAPAANAEAAPPAPAERAAQTPPAPATVILDPATNADVRAALDAARAVGDDAFRAADAARQLGASLESIRAAAVRALDTRSALAPEIVSQPSPQAERKTDAEIRSLLDPMALYNEVRESMSSRRRTGAR
jgi:HK97 family phage prohead protease